MSGEQVFLTVSGPAPHVFVGLGVQPAGVRLYRSSPTHLGVQIRGSTPGNVRTRFGYGHAELTRDDVLALRDALSNYLESWDQ